MDRVNFRGGGLTRARVCPDYQSDSDSFNPTLWEEQRQQRMTVAFDFEDKKEEEDNSGKVKVSQFSFQSSSRTSSSRSSLIVIVFYVCKVVTVFRRLCK